MKSKLWLVLLILVIVALMVVVCSQPSGRPTRDTGTTQRISVAGGPDRAFVYAGLPQSSEPVKLLKNKGYILGYSETRKDPLWVAYRVFKVNNPPKYERPAQFIVDDRTEAKVRPQDCTGTGYDRGHMAPNYVVGTRYGQDAQLETFLMSNICPQWH